MRVQRSVGALACGIAIGLGAYAAHGVTGIDQLRLAQAAIFAFGHGVALTALTARATRRLARTAFVLLMLGLVLFAGSLALAVLLDTSTTLAPVGGVLLMLGWALLAIDGARG